MLKIINNYSDVNNGYATLKGYKKMEIYTFTTRSMAITSFSLPFDISSEVKEIFIMRTSPIPSPSYYYPVNYMKIFPKYKAEYNRIPVAFTDSLTSGSYWAHNQMYKSTAILNGSVLKTDASVRSVTESATTTTPQFYAGHEYKAFVFS